jgi:hypothetical protein
VFHVEIDVMMPFIWLANCAASFNHIVIKPLALSSCKSSITLHIEVFAPTMLIRSHGSHGPRLMKVLGVEILAR